MSILFDYMKLNGFISHRVNVDLESRRRKVNVLEMFYEGKEKKDNIRFM